MHYNKKNNDLIRNEINTENSLNFHSSTPTKETDSKNITSKGALFFEANAKNKSSIIVHETSNIGTYPETTKTTSCTSSTDSGVNVSDNDEILPSPVSSELHSFPSSTSSSSGTTSTTTVNLYNKEFLKNNKNTKRDNSNINNNKSNIHYNIHIFDGDNCDYESKGNDDEIDKSVDNKLNSEQHRKRQQQLSQQLSKVENGKSNGNNNCQYETNQNAIGGGENVINIGDHWGSIKTNTPTPVSPITTTANKNIPLLQHNEFAHSLHKSPSTSSSLSIPSSTISYNNNPPSKMHHCNGSPVVSIRSINSTIITSDSDSDLHSDSDGGNENYVIKKLGTQVTYPPKHPDIPNINSHTVLNQKVIPNDENVVASPLATLAAIGDSIGAAQALGSVPSSSTVPQRPQIGSIALSNSSDVTFGDKHFYEGPVTIQQFLIDGRDKWKETNDNENPSFVNDDGTTNNAKDLDSTEEESGKLYGFILKRKKLIIPGVLTVVFLLVVAAIFGNKALNKSKNTNGDSECSGNGTLCLIDRDVWRAHPQKNKLDEQKLPLRRVIISHTASEACYDIRTCVESVRTIQEFHMNSLGWDDIAYNFLISSDGKVFVGRGWDYIGAHTKGYNTNSVGITFIGTYVSIEPTDSQLKACLAFLEVGVKKHKLSPDYRLYGARQFGATESPGNKLYEKIKKWPHWSADINLPQQ